MSEAPRRLLRALPLALPCLVFLLISLAGITNASIGELRQAPRAPHGHELGQPSPIRSDEYMTESPISLGWIAAGGRDIDNPLSQPPNFFHQLPSGPVSAVVFFDGTAAMLGPWLPDSVLFAARWWLPTLLLFVGLPLWFRQVTGTLRWGYLAALVIVFSPANMWWSGRPVNTLGFMFAGCALMLAGHDFLRRGTTVRAVAAFAGAGVLLARFPSYYQPFAIILGFPVLISTLVFLLLRDGERRQKVITMLVSGVVGAALTAGTMWENAAAIRSGLGTVYPGQRISTGVAQPFGKIFGAPALGAMESVQRTMLPSTNATESSTSFTVLFLVAALLWLARGWRAPRRAYWAFVVWMAFTAFWLAWCTTNFGSFGSHLPIINLVPAIRAANDVGFLAVVAFFLLLAHWRPALVRWPAPVVVSLLTGIVTLSAGFAWRHEGIPDLPFPSIWAGAIVATIVVFLIVRWPESWASWSTVALSVVALTAFVNPIEIGLADLRGSDTAHYMISSGSHARTTDELWASDDPTFDALMFATATPALSGRQQVGPNDREWLKLDPGGAHEDVWNRGGTYIRFSWSQNPEIQWSNPTVDQILMQTSPCTVADREPRLRYVVSSSRLDARCLEPVRRLRWSGRPHFVYELRHMPS